MVELVDTEDLKSLSNNACAGSSPVRGTYNNIGPIAQRIEQHPSKLLVLGSIPSGTASYNFPYA